jgi:hypothetical protein
MVTRLRWAAEKEFTVETCLLDLLAALKPVSGNLRTR